jgi:hypothetical protein
MENFGQCTYSHWNWSQRQLTNRERREILVFSIMCHWWWWFMTHQQFLIRWRSKRAAHYWSCIPAHQRISPCPCMSYEVSELCFKFVFFEPLHCGSASQIRTRPGRGRNQSSRMFLHHKICHSCNNGETNLAWWPHREVMLKPYTAVVL